MTQKVKKKWLDTGSGTAQINAQSFLATYTAINYTPDQVDSEGNDKISAHLKGLDTKVGILSGSSFVDQVFTGDGVEDTFVVTEPFDGTTKIDVFLNGNLKEETDDYTRDAIDNEIITVDPLPNLAKMKVRIHSATPFIDEFFAGGVATLSITNTFGNATKIDVFFNGNLKEEADDWTRDSNANEIDIVGGAGSTTAQTSIRVRLYS